MIIRILLSSVESLEFFSSVESLEFFSSVELLEFFTLIQYMNGWFLNLPQHNKYMVNSFAADSVLGQKKLSCWINLAWSIH